MLRGHEMKEILSNECTLIWADKQANHRRARKSDGAVLLNDHHTRRREIEELAVRLVYLSRIFFSLDASTRFLVPRHLATLYIRIMLRSHYDDAKRCLFGRSFSSLRVSAVRVCLSNAALPNPTLMARVTCMLA